MDTKDTPLQDSWIVRCAAAIGDRLMPELDLPTRIKNEPKWQHTDRRKKPDNVRRAKANRARAERKRKQKAAKRR